MLLRRRGIPSCCLHRRSNAAAFSFHFFQDVPVVADAATEVLDTVLTLAAADTADTADSADEVVQRDVVVDVFVRVEVIL